MYVQSYSHVYCTPLSCVKCVEGDERAYYLKTQAERKQRFMKVKKGLKQRGQDKVCILS